MAAASTWRPYTKTIRPRRSDIVLHRHRFGLRWLEHQARVLDTTTADIDGTVVVEYLFPSTGRSSVSIRKLKVLRLAAKKY